MKIQFRRKNIPIPNFWICNKKQDLIEISEKINSINNQTT